MKNLFSIISLLLISFTGVTVVHADQYALVVNDAQPLANKVCATCHGGAGFGNPVVGAPSLAGLEPWYLRNQLTGFRNHFRGAEKEYIPALEMRDSVASLSDAEIDQLVAYISAWEPVFSAPTLSGDISRGSELYTSCAACHGNNAQGNALLNAPGLAARDDWYLLRQLKLFKSGYRGGHPDDLIGQQMRAAVSVLDTEQDMTDVLAYIKTLQ